MTWLLPARGRRLADLQSHGLLMEDADSGTRFSRQVTTLSEVAPGERFDLVLVAVRADQLAGALSILTGMSDRSDVLVFGNIGEHGPAVAAGLGERALFGFPAAGGVRNGATLRYVLINQQKTMLGEPDGAATPRVRLLQQVLSGAGFPTMISADIGGWLVGHAAFVVPIASALYRVGTDSRRLADAPTVMRPMVLATKEAFNALRANGNREIPTNLRMLYSLPTPLVVAYWRRILNGPHGELWFGAHSRAAPEEMHELALTLLEVVRGTGRPVPHLKRLLEPE